MSKTKFGSFVRNGVRYNCKYDPDSFKKGKGYKVEYYKKHPHASNFLYASHFCYAKKVEAMMCEKCGRPTSNTGSGFCGHCESHLEDVILDRD